MHRAIAILTMLGTGCYTFPGEPACEDLPLPDPVVTECDDDSDIDGDGITDCYDPDIDGDQLRNGWDCDPLDGTKTQVHAGGRCDDPDDRGDGDLLVAAGATELFEPPSTTLLLDAASGDTSLRVDDGSLFKEGDEILIIDLQGDGAGTYEYVLVASSDDTSITVEPSLSQDFDAADIVRIQRVPHYGDVTINGTLTTASWAEGGTGIIMFRACGQVDLPGTLSVKGLGFAGGAGVAGNTDGPTTGESWVGPSIEPEIASDEISTYDVGARNGGGGGAPIEQDGSLKDQSAGGAGGSYGTVGEYSYSEDGESYAQPGETYGETDLSTWFIGSGGGGGAPDPEDDGADEENISGGGGAGGGSIVVFARERVDVAGTLSAKGGRGEDAESQAGSSGGFPVGGEVGGGGGGSGGMVMVVSQTIAVTASGDAEGITIQYGEGGFPAGNGQLKNEDEEDNLVRGGHGGYGLLRLDAETLDLSGNLSVPQTDGEPVIHEGDYGEWCWESVPVPQAPCETDADGDGVLAWECGGDDCDDADAGTFPGASEIADDGIDQDCDGVDLCSSPIWITGGMKVGGCATGGDAGGAAAAVGLALLLLRRRRT